MPAQPSELSARLIDIFGSPATADPTKLYGNLAVSPAGNILVGTLTDDATNKFQVNGGLKATGTLTVNSATAPWLSYQVGGVVRFGFGYDGSNFVLNRYNTSGTYTDTPFYVNQSNGQVSMALRPTWGGATPWDTTNLHPCYSNTGSNMAFNYSAQGGQPTYLWGTNDGVNMYVWTPSNFSVNYANSAGSVGGISTPARAVGNAFSFQWDGGAGNVNITVDSSFVAYVHTNVSDVRLKENIQPIKEDSLALIDQIDFKEYDFKVSGRHVNTGLIAQEVEVFAPDWIHTAETEDYKDAKFLHTHNMLLSAMHAIQQLSAEVKSLREEVSALKGNT